MMRNRAIQDEVLGWLEVRSNGWIVGSLVVQGEKVPFGIAIVSDVEDDWQVGLQLTRRLWASLENSELEFRQNISQELLDTLSECDDDLGIADVVEQLRLCRIEVEIGDGESCLAKVMYSADELLESRLACAYVDDSLRIESVMVE
ncbi:MAG: hypothetical protein U0930_21725 [Pirellulales bacterium]